MGKVFSTVIWSLCAPNSFESICFSKITVSVAGVLAVAAPVLTIW